MGSKKTTRAMRHGATGLVLIALAGCVDSQSADRAAVEIKGTAPGSAAAAPASPAAPAIAAPGQPVVSPEGIASYDGYQAAIAREGETVADVAGRIGLSGTELGAYNGLQASHRLRAGDELVLPPRPGGYGTPAPAAPQPAAPSAYAAPAPSPTTGGVTSIELKPLAGAAPATVPAEVPAAPAAPASSGAWSPDIAAAAIARSTGIDSQGNLAAPPSSAEPLPPPPVPRRPPDLRGVSFVLLLGADNRSDAVVGRTDAMIVVGFRHRDGEVAAFSIPRDLWVPLPDVGTLHAEGRTHARVSSVVRVGEARLGPGEGMPLLRRVLHDELGIRVDRHATIDFRGFSALVDALGGVEVDVECPIMDCFWLNGVDQPCVMMQVEAGRQRMDGATALAFVRSRHGTGDRDRTRRQQAVLVGVARQVRAAGLRGLPGLWRTAADFVDTDIEASDALYYGSYALDTPLDQIHGFGVRHPMTARHVTPDNKHVMLLDREQFDRALERMFDAALPALRARKTCPEPDAALHD